MKVSKKEIAKFQKKEQAQLAGREVNRVQDRKTGELGMNRIHPELNPLEVLLVCQHYEQQGITHYTLTKGNDCIWAYRGQINEYFIFRDGAIVDIQID